MTWDYSLPSHCVMTNSALLSWLLTISSINAWTEAGCFDGQQLYWASILVYGKFIKSFGGKVGFVERLRLISSWQHPASAELDPLRVRHRRQMLALQRAGQRMLDGLEEKSSGVCWGSSNVCTPKPSLHVVVFIWWGRNACCKKALFNICAGKSIDNLLFTHIISIY